MKTVVILMGFCALLCQTGCQPGKAEEQTREAGTKLLVTSPMRMDTSLVKEYVCQIHSIRHIELRAQERGYLEQILVDEGQFVKRGQLLFRIMPRLYEAELQRAQAEVKFAEIEYLNTRNLADSNIVAPNELALAMARLDKAKAELSLAQVHLSFTEIRAPFDGMIDRLEVRIGSLVDEGELLTRLADNSKMWVYFNVPEAEYLDYRMKVKRDSAMSVNLLMANNKPFTYPGVVQTIEADFNNETGNIAFRATFPNPDGLLRHGETGSILMAVPLENAVIIPQKATFEVLEKKYVYVVDDKNEVVSREITIGTELPDLYVVSEGVSEHDKILLEGLRKVRDRDRIAYEYAEPEKVVGHLELYAE